MYKLNISGIWFGVVRMYDCVCVHVLWRWEDVWGFMYVFWWKFLDCLHGVCEWMKGHNVNELYTVTCNCMIYCETFK